MVYRFGPAKNRSVLPSRWSSSLIEIIVAAPVVEITADFVSSKSRIRVLAVEIVTYCGPFHGDAVLYALGDRRNLSAPRSYRHMKVLYVRNNP